MTRYYPYHTQTNNEVAPGGTCNVTCLAMALRGLGWECPDPGQQSEDYLARKMQSLGLDRESPLDLAAIVREVAPSIPWRFDFAATWDQIDAHLAKDKPVILHGYFTDAGHVVLAIAVEGDTYTVLDPWGRCLFPGYERNYEWGPDHGDHVQYSRSQLTSVCEDKGIWAHFGG